MFSRFWADPDTWEKISYSIRKFLFLFACTNSCANPLIYGAFTNKRSGIFASRERLYFLQTGKKNRKWKVSFSPVLQDKFPMVGASKKYPWCPKRRLCKIERVTSDRKNNRVFRMIIKIKVKTSIL